eukprot:gene24404-10010_t
MESGSAAIDSIGAVSYVDEALMKIDAAFMMCHSLKSIDRLAPAMLKESAPAMREESVYDMSGWMDV